MIMKRLFLISTIIATSLLTGCAAAWQEASIGDDLYTLHSRTEIAQRKKAEAEAAKAEAEARAAAWEAKLAEARAAAAEGQYYAPQSDSYSSVLADTYESAYARRLYGFASPTYRMPSSYFALQYSDAFHYASAYDPAYYNVMVAGDQVWVEPKYITSMFGQWGAVAVAPTYGWYYGWSRPYYSWLYGYPRYSWYDWNWHIGYDPFWGWGFGFGWGYPSYGIGGPYPPHHLPPFVGGGHIHHHRPTVVSRPTTSRPGGRPAYISGGSGRPSSPVSGSSGSSNRTIRRNSGTVTGSGEYRGSSGSVTRPQNSGSRATESFNRRGDSNSFGGGSNFGGYSGGYSGGGNASGGSHGGGQHRR